MRKKLRVLVSALLFSVVFKVHIGTALTLESVPPEQAGVSSAFLHDILNQIRVGGLDIHSLIVIKNDKLILEAYLDPYTEYVLHNVKSVSKSVLSALAGIALEQGLIGSVEATLTEALPEYFEPTADARKADITLHHLLTMSSGFDFTEHSERAGKWFKAKNPVREAIALPITAIPGEQFRYATINTHIFSAWLTKAAAMSTPEFAEKYLFTPLGIDSCHWVKDPQGIYWGGTQLYLTPRDMARFGMLYLHKGHTQEEQLIPERWVDESTRWRYSVDTHSGYGYWWWRIPASDGYVAAGWGGQRIAVFPGKELVIVVTAANQHHARYVFQQLHAGITPIDALDDNPAAFARLTSMVDQLAKPVDVKAGRIPETAASISGTKYRFKSNPLSISSMTISFDQADTAQLEMQVEGRTLQMAVGLDGSYRVTPGVALDSHREDNAVAVRARWHDERLIVDWHEIGEPLRIETTLMFEDNKVLAMVTHLPMGRISHLEGTMAE